MKAVVVHGPGDIRYEDLPLPCPGPGEALIEMRAAGVCSSDLPRALGDAAVVGVRPLGLPAIQLARIMGAARPLPLTW